MAEPESINSEKPDPENPSPLIERRHHLGRLLTVLMFAILLGLYGFQLWYHATRTSATVDESPHILAGYRYWQCGDFGINPEHPPLLKLLATIPLVSKDLIQPSWDCGSKATFIRDSYLAGNIFLAKNNPDSIVIPARLMAALMSLLLAVLVFLAAREMFGRWEAVVALALLAFEPNLVAHGSLVTTDMALTATMFAAVYALYRYRKNPSVVRFLIVGLAVGLTLASKHSGILILPILFLLLITDILLFRRTETGTRLSNQLLRHAAVFAGVVFIGFVLLWASYGFRYYALPNATQNTLSIEEFLTLVPPERANSTGVQTVKALSRIRILPESYTFGLAQVLATGSRDMFLFGKIYPTGRWFYFPAAFSIKTSIALLVLLAVGLLTFKLYRVHRREMLFLLVPSLVVFAVSLTSQMNIGVRHILPVYPFFIVIAAAGACTLARKYRAFFYALLALLLFHAFTAVRTAPNYIAFANDFWGGTKNTHRLLDDSNVEWGQNFKFVNDYLARENVSNCWIAPFGNGELIRRYQPCRLMPGAPGWNSTELPVEPVPQVIEGTVLLSSAVLPPSGGDEYLPFLQSEPVALIGGSVFVYRGRFEIPLLAALSYRGRGRQYSRLKRFDEAIADGRKAVELAPNDPRMHLFLGITLARAGKNDEARQELEATVRLAQSNLDLFRGAQESAQEELKKLP